MNRDFSLNILYRYMMVPPIMTFRLLRKIFYQFSNDSNYIRGLKNRYKGQRCFIIGNGPSLRISDLNKISNEITFGTNRIYSLFDKTEWRPSFYVAIDNNVLKDNREEINKVEASHKFINVTAKAYGINSENTTFINMFGPYLIKPYLYETKKVCGDVSKAFTLSYSVTGVAMELAVYMGFKEIYLIGIDHNYSNYIDKNGIYHSDDSVKDYFGSLKTKSYTIQYRDATESYYKAFREYSELYNIKIYNATRGGRLEVFERIDLDKVV